MDSRKILAAVLLIFLAKASAQSCGSAIKTFQDCMHSTSSDSSSSTDTEQRLRTCFTNAGCSQPAGGISDDEEVETGGTRPGESIAAAVEKCTTKLQQEDIQPKLQSCMEGKIAGWQFPAITHHSGGQSHSANQLVQLKRKYVQGLKSGNLCTTKEAKVEGRKCLKVVRAAGKGHRGGRKHAGDEDPQKRQQCMERITNQECASKIANIHQYICECAGEHLKDRSIRTQLGTKLETCVRHELHSLSLNPEQTRKMEGAIRKAGKALAQKCKGGRGGRRRGGQGQRRNQRVRGGEDEE